MATDADLRLGIDLGGTKIAGVVLDAAGQTAAERRVPTPAGDYAATVRAVAELVGQLEREAGASGLSVGVDTPGAVSPSTGRIKNANSTCLNGQPLQTDLEATLNRPVRLANDADCLAVSEAADGAGAGATSVFGVILGTGVGGALVVNGQLLAGPNAIAGEWGHNPLPWPDPDTELPGPRCWCGKQGCHETWLSGPGLAADFAAHGGEHADASVIVARAAEGEKIAESTLANYEDRLARGLASVINILDPEVIVLGGGLSCIERLYRNVPGCWGDYVFSDRVDTRLVPAKYGDASGVRGAAGLF